MASTTAERVRARSWANIQSHNKHKPEVQTHIQQQEQASVQSPRANEQIQRHIQGDSTEEIGEQSREETENASTQAVVVKLRDCRLALLPGHETDPDYLCQEAAYFDQIITYREARGRFETMASLREHFVVQYDETDVDEAGTPKCVIGITEDILEWDSESEEKDDKGPDGTAGKEGAYDEGMQEEGGEEEEEEEGQEKHKMFHKTTIKVNTPKPVPGTKRRASVLGVVGPRAKKLCRRRWWHNNNYVDCSCNSDTDDGIDTDTDSDTDEDDEPPDWSEYENGNTCAKQSGLDDEPKEILNTRVEFAKVDRIPERVYKRAFESKDPRSKPRDYLIRGLPFPTEGDFTPVDAFGWRH